MSNNENVYCRLCAELKPQHKLLNLKTDGKKCLEIVNKLSRFNVEMTLSGNILPKTVCYTCINSLNRAFDFVVIVEQAQASLNSLILEQQIKKEEDEPDDDFFAYDTPDVNYDDNIKVKVEGAKVVSSKKPVSKNTIKSEETTKKTKNIANSLDTLPLSQLNLSWKDYNWLCTYCETQFASIDELRNHSMQYHNCCNAYRCTDCRTRKLRLDSFLMHVRRHRKYLKFSCYKCLEKFKSLQESNSHKAVHLNSDYICSGCNLTFENKDELVKHTSTFYQKVRARALPAPFKNEGLTCMLCEKTCKTKSNMHTHLLTHTDRKKDYTCEICGKCFIHKANLAEHLIKHTDERPYQCELCKSAFKTPKQLQRHVGVHDGQKPFSCDQCGKCFRLKTHLKNHSIVHTDSLPHVCSYCNKRFRFRTILNQHVRQHTGVKPYSCTICKRDFTNWPNYNKHMKRKHGMDMAKKKHTPEGMYPIDATTGEVIYPKTDKMLEWKKKILENGKSSRHRTIKKSETLEECEEKVINKESNNIINE